MLRKKQESQHEIDLLFSPISVHVHTFPDLCVPLLLSILLRDSSRFHRYFFCMVRVFPAHYPFTSHGWQGHSLGYQPSATMEIRDATFQTSSRGTAAVPLVCVRAKESHSYGIFYGQNPLMFSFNVVLVDLILIILITRTVRFLLKPLRQPSLGWFLN